jgi:cyclopropane-fatty-acyl-phospholipid synthase
MAATIPADSTTAADRSFAVLRTMFGPRFAHSFAVELWNGTRVDPVGPPRFTLRINAPFALRAAFTPPLDLSPGLAFAQKWLDIEGDVEAAIDEMELAFARISPVTLPGLLANLLRLPKPPPAPETTGAQLRGRRHSPERDAEAIGFHYDQPISFYRSFLGDRMVYSCAYWDDGVQTLDDAQIAKIDHTLRKVRLAPGERLLDIGCGWGALVIRAAQRFGAHALGITLSEAQHDEAQRRIAAAGVADRVRVERRDYRDVRGETFDKVVSVGMVEHVGRERLDHYFRAAYDALREGGLFLNHGIGQQSRDGRGYRVGGFMARYVFPDGDLIGIDAVLRGAERAGFEIRDVENLREHYARTLRAWYANLDANRERAIAATDERTFRIWRMYLAGSARNFWRGQMGLFQTLLAKNRSGPAVIPATRRDLYMSR